MSAPNAEDSRHSALERAASQLRAAELLLLDPHLAADLADPHLDRAAEELGVADEPRSDAAGLQRLAGLRDVLEARRREVSPGLIKRARMARLMFALVLVLLPTLAYVGVKWLTTDAQPWRVSYYANQKLEGDPVVYYENDVDFEWGELAPVDEITPNDWSARYETCLVLERRSKIAFQLSSDDGSRLFVDGKRVVGNWGVHGLRTRSGRIRLDPGQHALEVRYFDRSGVAQVELQASIRGGLPERLPLSMLEAPDEDAPVGEACKR